MPIYCTSNIYLKCFLCATTLRKRCIYKIFTLVNYKFINMSMHLLHKFKQVDFFNSLYATQLPGARSTLITL